MKRFYRLLMILFFAFTMMNFYSCGGDEECTDDDNDGYGNYCDKGLDCDDDNDDIYPGAPELCDGRDNQCPGDEGYGQVDEGCKP